MYVLDNILLTKKWGTFFTGGGGGGVMCPRWTIFLGYLSRVQQLKPRGFQPRFDPDSLCVGMMPTRIPIQVAQPTSIRWVGVWI